MNRFSEEVPVVDVHQHVWPHRLIEALRNRRTPPRLRGWTLELAGEPDYEVDPRDHDADERAELARRDGLDLALVSLSSPLGIESLAPHDASELIDAYHEGALALPEPFGAWAAARVTEVDAGALSRELERGFVGLQLPATSLLDGAGYDNAGPLLDVLEEAGLPLLVHPGPVAGGTVAPGTVAGAPGAGGTVAPGTVAGAPGAGGTVAPGAIAAAAGEPPWWPAIVSYVQQMHAAWFAFRVHGRPRHPRLRVCFAMLAGLAPLHSERVAARAGDRGVVDQDVFLDVSSYGTRAVDATVRVLGIDTLVNGSDRPYAEPVSLELGPAALHAIRSTNAMRLLYPSEVFDDLAIASPRNLDRAELQALVDALAAEPDGWREHVAFEAGQRHYVSLHRDEYVDVWLLCWVPGDDTGWHDHDISSGAVRVVRGAVRESNPRIGGEPAVHIVTEGGSFSFGPEHIHRLAGEDELAISIHAYSPPLWRLGQYSIDDDGVMRRASVSYADELRPLEGSLAA